MLTRGRLPASSFPSGVSQVDTVSGEKVFMLLSRSSHHDDHYCQDQVIMMIIIVNFIAEVTLVSLGSRRAIFTSAGAATLIKTYSVKNGVVHIIDSLV